MSSTPQTTPIATTHTQQLLFSNPCSNAVQLDGGTDAATRNSMSVQLLQDNQTGQGVVNLTPTGGSTYQNGTTFRNITINGSVSEERMCGLNSTEIGATSDMRSPLSQYFLPQIQISSQYSTPVQQITEFAYVVKTNADVDTKLYKTENFLTWLNSSIDRLHDMREFEPPSSVRALLYNNFMQDFIVLSDGLANIYLSLLSEFLGRAHSDRPDFWGTVQSDDGQSTALTFEDYVRGGGPLLELQAGYIFPPIAKIRSMNDEKKILMKQFVYDLKTYGIPLVRIMEFDRERDFGTELQVQSTVNIDIATEGKSSLADGTLARIDDIDANKIKKLFLHFRGLTSKDQKYANIDGANVLLLLDAYKKPFPHQMYAFQTSPSTYIAAIDKANAKKWTVQKREDIQQISEEARDILLPQAGSTRQFEFRRYDNQIVQTSQMATVTTHMEIDATGVLQTIYSKITEVQQALVAQLRGASGFPQAIQQILKESNYVDASRCAALEEMFETQQYLKGILQSGDNKTVAKTGASRQAIIKERGKLIKIIKAFEGNQHFSSMKKEDLDKKQTIGALREELLFPLAERILEKLPNIEKMTKQGSPLDIITQCESFYMVEVDKTSDGQIIINTPTGTYQPLTCLDSLFGPEVVQHDFIRRQNEKDYIPLLTVEKLEHLILDIVSTRTVRSLDAEMQANTSFGSYIDRIIRYVIENAESLSFLSDDIQSAFLEKVSHVEFAQYKGEGRYQDANVHTGTTKVQRTATVAGHIFEPTRHTGLVKDSDDDTDRIDTGELAERIKAMPPQEILKAILIASMSIGNTTGMDMDEEQEGKEQKEPLVHQAQSIFVTIDRAIRQTIGLLSLSLNKIYTVSAQQQQLDKTLTFVTNILTDQGADVGMYNVVLNMCRTQQPQMVVRTYLTERLIPLIFDLFSQRINITISTSLHTQIMQQLHTSLESFGDKTIGDLCEELSSQETKNSDLREIDIQWYNYQSTQHVSQSTEDEPFMTGPSSFVFGRRFINAGRDSAEELPLLATIVKDVNSAVNKPTVTLASTIFPNAKFGVSQGVSETSISAVSVAQVHRQSFTLYESLLLPTVKGLLTKNQKKLKKTAIKTGLGRTIYTLWLRRLQMDETVDITGMDPIKLFEQVILDHIGRIETTMGDSHGSSEGDDDDAIPGEIKLDPITSETKIGFSRSLNGISGFGGKHDKAQRCLHYTIKSLAYSFIPQILGLSSLGIQETSFRDAALQFCCRVRAYEGLKSAGDLLPLLVARSMNLCYSFKREGGLPITNIFGGASFDKLCTISAHLHKVPSVMIDVKGGILCFGGFRGKMTSTNYVPLNNNPTLVAQLDLQLASCDTYWIGRQNNLFKRTLHFLVLLLAQVIKSDQTNYETFVSNYRQIMNASDHQIIGFINKILNVVMANADRNITMEFINRLNGAIDGYNERLLRALGNPCSNSEEIYRRAAIQQHIRTQTIQMLLQILGNTNTNLSQILKQFLESLQKFIQQPQQLGMTPGMATGMMLQQPQQLGMTPQQQQAQKQPTQAQQMAQQQMVQQQPLPQQQPAQAQNPVKVLIKNSSKLIREAGDNLTLFIHSTNKTKSQKREIASHLRISYDELNRTLRDIGEIRGNVRGANQMALESIAAQIIRLMEEIKKNVTRRGGSRKRRHRRRKTRRKKKNRKKKTIKRRRKRGRKTRRK